MCPTQSHLLHTTMCRHSSIGWVKRKQLWHWFLISKRDLGCFVPANKEVVGTFYLLWKVLVLQRSWRLTTTHPESCHSIVTGSSDEWDNEIWPAHSLEEDESRKFLGLTKLILSAWLETPPPSQHSAIGE